MLKAQEDPIEFGPFSGLAGRQGEQTHLRLEDALSAVAVCICCLSETVGNVRLASVKARAGTNLSSKRDHMQSNRCFRISFEQLTSRITRI